MEQTAPPSDPNHTVFQRMWGMAFLFAGFLFSFFLVYVVFAAGSFSLLSFSNAVAGTAAIMIGSSFAMSSICYYFDFFDKKIMYRKYFGLTGFALAFFYSTLLLFVNPERYFYGFFENFFSADFILGLSAVTIFTGMALISNAWAMKKLGPKTWKQALRFGYLAYGLLVIRAAIMEHAFWYAWLKEPFNPPPLRLLLSLFAVTVITLRISVIVTKYFERKTPLQAASQPIASPVSQESK